MYTRESSVRETTVPQRRRTPSFSSTLLDAIYRSIDEPTNGVEAATLCHYKEAKKATTNQAIAKKQGNGCLEEEEEDQRKGSSLRRAIMIEDWVEKQSHFNSTSSSSDSSSAGIFSSSEAESSYKEKTRRSTPAKPGKSSMHCFDQNNKNKNNNQPKAKCSEVGGGFSKTKLKALKIYGELKKVKQPISPGGRLTNFLNSIFNANSKKVKMCSVGVRDDVSLERRKSKSACSSATSFSRSCLSKTPSSSTTSRGANNNKYGNGKKRTVRFCPVTVIVDEDCRPCGHKCIYEDDPSLMPTSTVHQKSNVIKVSSRKEELIMKNFIKEKESGSVGNKARDYLRSYQRMGTGKFDLRGLVNNYEVEDDDEEEDDDALSYSSSDLFELDHLIGIGRYREELPVYETTSFKTNQAIANGFRL